MTEYSLAADIAKSLGVSGLIIWVVWKLASQLMALIEKLTDRWAGKFLEVQDRQAKAMGEMSGAVREGQGQSQELLIAVRVIASKVDETKAGVKELSQYVLGRKETA